MSKQRVVIITGGGSGMGQKAAELFAKNGDKVFILGRHQDKLNAVAKGQPEITGVVADVTDLKSLQAVRKTILDSAKSVDVLVNAAGGNVPVAEDASLEEQQTVWKQVVDINLTGVFNVIAVFNEHINDGGRIINITSLAAIGGSRQGGVSGQAYSAAKSGVHGMSRTLVSKFSPRNITVNCIAPGLIKNTDFFGGGQPPEALADYYLPKTPLKRMGEPEEIAAGIFYLASKEASFITGEILNINGGVQFGR